MTPFEKTERIRALTSLLAVEVKSYNEKGIIENISPFSEEEIKEIKSEILKLAK